MGVSAFPITHVTVRRRSATSNPGKTYGLYVNHLKKADIMLRNEPTSHNMEIRTVANGWVARKIKASCSRISPNRKAFLGSWNAKTARLSPEWLTYHTPISVHSETLQLTRAASSGPPLKSLPRESKALIGAQTLGEIHVLAIKAKYRKNPRG